MTPLHKNNNSSSNYLKTYACCMNIKGFIAEFSSKRLILTPNTVNRVLSPIKKGQHVFNNDRDYSPTFSDSVNRSQWLVGERSRKSSTSHATDHEQRRGVRVSLWSIRTSFKVQCVAPNGSEVASPAGHASALSCSHGKLQKC